MSPEEITESDLVTAVAVDSQETLSVRHFGSAEAYLLYRHHADGFESLTRVRNETLDEVEEGAAAKAGSVKDLLDSHGVHVVVGGCFGPNIKRIVRHFVPVMDDPAPVDVVLDHLHRRWNRVAREWMRPDPEREHIRLREGVSATMVASVDAALCQECGLCEPSCPVGAITAEGLAMVDRWRCVRCGACVDICPFDAISMKIK
jgi:ferredoxin